ncbi:MAG TPA: hypothetical protein ENO28_02245 [Bacteroidetes bacterium]|nr:hypothetical protein [Bacteroidota bacterium]
MFRNWWMAICLVAVFTTVDAQRHIVVNFYKDPFEANLNADKIELPQQLTPAGLQKAYQQLNTSQYQPLINALLAYKATHQLNDWLYYQLIRHTAQQIAPKQDNYPLYTFYKWLMLSRSGYDARLALSHQKIIFYVYNNEEIKDIPYFMVDEKQFVCLNIHDYAYANLNTDPPVPVILPVPDKVIPFSYKVTLMPDFTPAGDVEKSMSFRYGQQTYHFKIRLNTNQQAAFNNYPGVSFETYFNIPLSRETYSSLIPTLKSVLKGMDEKKGVDYLMRFTRYAFLYEDDQENYGRERRLSPGETLAATYSDCDDRAALFFFLVKELYNLPMIAMLYPTHITMAVGFNKPVGEAVNYNGKVYTVCEPTPQAEDLHIGQLSAKLKNQPFQIVYAYEPSVHK